MLYHPHVTAIIVENLILSKNTVALRTKEEERSIRAKSPLSMYQRIAKILTSALVAFSVVSPVSAATTVTVKADKPSGTYEAPFDVRIQASDPTAKIWYAFDPNGSPGDALPYSKPIRIEKSTPLLFFAYTDYEHESKIERRDYVVLSPTTLRFKDASVSIAAEAADFSVTVENF